MEYIVQIIIGVFSLVGTIISVILTNSKFQVRTEEQMKSNHVLTEEQIKGIKEDIGTLSDRVDKHNNLIERTAVLETKVEGLENGLKG